MAYTPPEPGTPTFAGWWTTAWRAILQHTRLVGGNGVVVTPMEGGGWVVGLGGMGSRVFEARITEAPTYAPTAPDACRYGARAWGREGLVLADALPEYGRPTRENEWMLWPAKVGERCFVMRTTEADGSLVDRLWVLTEAISAKPCAG